MLVAPLQKYNSKIFRCCRYDIVFLPFGSAQQPGLSNTELESNTAYLNLSM